MAFEITLSGIDQAISGLSYRNEKALKYRLLHAIRQRCMDEKRIADLQEIETDELVRALWDTGDNTAIIVSRRKNLNSVRSTVNSDLKKLFKEGKNPQGLILSAKNTFVISDEAKDELLKSFKDKGDGNNPIDLGQIAEILNIIDDMLAKPDVQTEDKAASGTGPMADIKALIRELSDKVGLPGTIEDSDLSKEGEIPGAAGSDTGSTGIDHDEILVALDADEDTEAIEEDEILEDAFAGENVEEDPYEIDVIEPENVDDVEEEIDLADEDEVLEDDIAEESLEEDLEAIDIDETLEEDDVDAITEECIDEESDEDFDEVVDDDVDEVLDAGDFGNDIGDIESADTSAAMDGLGDFDELGETDSTDVMGEETIPDFDSGEADDSRKAQMLAEAFNRSLAAMDRFYNQYIFIPEGEYLVADHGICRNTRSAPVGRPDRRISIQAFYMGKFPVTNALFGVFVERTGYTTTAEKLGYGMVYRGRSRRTRDEQTGRETLIWNATISNKTVNGACWYQPDGPGSTIHKKQVHPVSQVSIEDAIAFASWTGKRLPTEAEWESASRTADGYAFPWGNEWECEACNIEGSQIGDTTPVDAYKAFGNDLGILDTIGNVMEWTMDLAGPSSGKKGEQDYYVAKGGSWISGDDICPSSRFEMTPDFTSNVLGFRCVTF